MLPLNFVKMMKVIFIKARERSCEKVIFSQASVCPREGGTS